MGIRHHPNIKEHGHSRSCCSNCCLRYSRQSKARPWYQTSPGRRLVGKCPLSNKRAPNHWFRSSCFLRSENFPTDNLYLDHRRVFRKSHLNWQFRPRCKRRRKCTVRLLGLGKKQALLHCQSPVDECCKKKDNPQFRKT